MRLSLLLMRNDKIKGKVNRRDRLQHQLYKNASQTHIERGISQSLEANFTSTSSPCPLPASDFSARLRIAVQ
ncbi:hypothetical protein K491DRAFT_693581 [Lophiostoma macrostomum CBS 122681]|uniref:Uncharacterized protein n=1 Tax=Lophiostoma macrostomum CBS 122681 TaxID=1314788 RepID=A0A6A6T4E9_9PLEO|nr:hypothetical protein K491DRAFT_693581 [Lophiostoma macrostomum CBS 122681]